MNIIWKNLNYYYMFFLFKYVGTKKWKKCFSYEKSQQRITNDPFYCIPHDRNVLGTRLNLSCNSVESFEAREVSRYLPLLTLTRVNSDWPESQVGKNKARHKKTHHAPPTSLTFRNGSTGLCFLSQNLAVTFDSFLSFTFHLSPITKTW